LRENVFQVSYLAVRIAGWHRR